MNVCPYCMMVTYADGDEVVVHILKNLPSAIQFCKEFVQEYPETVSKIDVIDNSTGEVVYTISAKVSVITIVEIEEYNPYDI